jgi:hypothetical protein
MISDIAVERVELRCPELHWQSVVDYDAVLYADAEGDTWEFFSVDGVPTPSPYTVDGALLCPICHRVVVRVPVARRFIPVPPGNDRTPRQPWLIWKTTSAVARHAIAVRHVNVHASQVC